MKIANFITLWAAMSPVVSAIRGVRRAQETMEPVKGDKNDDGGNDDGLGLPGGVGDILDQVLSGDFSCFSGSSTVQVLHKGSIAMKDLQVGDQVLTGTGTYQPVYAFAHKEVESVAVFVQLTTEAATLEMTTEHLVFLQGQNHPVRADAVQVGDVLRGQSAPAPVTRIGSIVKQGLYAPLTIDGTVVVDGIVASSYVSLQEASDMVQIDTIQLPISQHSFIHMALSPFRMVCQMVECQSYDEQGLAPYVAYGMQFAKWGQAQNFWIQVAVLAMVLLAMVVCMVVENSMGAPLVVAAVYAMMKGNGVTIRKAKTA